MKPAIGSLNAGVVIAKKYFVCKIPHMRILLRSFLFMILITVSQWVFAQPDQPDAAARQKTKEDFMTPGPMHKVLSILEGTWEGDVTFWPAPGVGPFKSKSRAVNKSVYDGLFQEQEHIGIIGGKPYYSKLIWGYDKARKKFFIFGIDNMGSDHLRTEGTFDSTTRTWTFVGAKTDALTGKDNILRETRQLTDNNTQIMNMYVPDKASGKEFHILQIVYTRQP